MDEFIVFGHLKKEHYQKIFWKFLDEVNHNASERIQGFPYITATVELAEYLIDRAVGAGDYGARDMRRVINNDFLQPLSDVVTKVAPGGAVIGDLEGDRVVFYDLILDEPKPINEE
jgi:ATP-dependent Clp protease ATP-binding subunit ClpA